MDRFALRDFLNRYWNDSELRDLCFILKIDYDSILGGSKLDKTRELVLLFERNGELSKLEQVCCKERPSQYKLLGTMSIDNLSINDGLLIAKNTLVEPLPAFDPSLKYAVVPGGTTALFDNYYIRRKSDDLFEREIMKVGSTIIIRSPRQSGKSSLLIRGIKYAEGFGLKVAYLDLQEQIEDKNSIALDQLLFRLMEELIYQFNLRLDIRNYWDSPLPSKTKATRLLGDTILTAINNPIVIAIDEADRLMNNDISAEFFGLLRAWHNRRSRGDHWQKLSLVLVISTEPYLLIQDQTQSPFNVGFRIGISDLDANQILELNERHSSPLTLNEVPKLISLLGGHPFLVRKAMYLMAYQDYTWQDIVSKALDSTGPFSDHLFYYSHFLKRDAGLKRAVKDIVRTNMCNSEDLFEILEQIGLVVGHYKKCSFRCGLYKDFFTQMFN